MRTLFRRYDSGNRYCVGQGSTSQANFAGGSTPSGLTFLEGHEQPRLAYDLLHLQPDRRRNGTRT